MNEAWILQTSEIRRPFARATWIPLRASQNEEQLGLKEGYVLAHAPQDASEPFWPPSAVCQVIDEVAAEHVERGVYSKGINEGGGQEREFGARYKGWADATLMYPRTSAMLMAISDDWLSRAEHEDVRAELGKMKT